MIATLNRRPATHVLWGKLSWHPAVAAWREVAPDAPEPERIEVTRDGRDSATYRLVGSGQQGVAIIARRVRTERAWVALTLYRWILSHLPVAAPRYRGFKPDSARFGWVFLEEAAARSDG